MKAAAYKKFKPKLSDLLYGGAFKMITRRQGGSDAGILFGMSRKLPTKPTQFAFECDFVLDIL